MATARPILGDVELELVQQISVDEDQTLVQHDVPGLEGDFLQRLDRRAARFALDGVLTGPESGDGLKTLRDKFRAAEPVSFVTDIATATEVGEVLIEEMRVRELAGKPERFEYSFALREYVAAEEAITEEPPEPEVPEPPADDIDDNVGTLIVEVTVEDRQDIDFHNITVTVQGTQQDDTSLTRTLTDRTDSTWTDESMPTSQGEYTVLATETNPQPLSGSATAAVRSGQTKQIGIRLRPTSNIAKVFAVHFRFDKAFVEPCMRAVLRHVKQYAEANRNEKLLIVGHTDKAGPEPYNQFLSERRARSVYTFVTAGLNEASHAAAIGEWEALRKTRPSRNPTGIEDSWGTHQYQHMLQDLGFFPGAIDGDHGPLTRAAVRAYRCHKGLPPGTDVDDAVWRALISDYLIRGNGIGIPADHFLPIGQNTELKWLGCGEEDPLDRRNSAFRPSRRVEMLFVRADRLSCQVPIPATLSGGDANVAGRCCFVSPWLRPDSSEKQPCPTDPAGPWCRQPAEPRKITVVGSILRELSDGTLEPVPNQPFVLTTPDGEFRQGEQSRGEPIPARTAGGTGEDRGTFSFGDVYEGVYSLEVVTPAAAPVLVRLREQKDADAKGNSVCRVMRSDTDRLDVVIINAPVMVEIKLPVVAHVMTALHPVTREIRTCPDPLNPSRRVPQSSAHTAAKIEHFLEGVNKIWRQARIRFTLNPANIVFESYSFRTECEVGDFEFTNVLLQRCAYPDAVNVFFVGDLAGTGEAGFGVSPENGAALMVAGCAVGDRFQSTVLGTPVNVALNAQQTIQVLAHELGHYLNLDHVSSTPANADRLMLPGTAAGTNLALAADEVTRARTSQGATDDCIPLDLGVANATQIGGSLNHQYIFVQHPDLLDPFDVTIDAKIPQHLLAVGTLTMTGGNPGASNLQRTVSKTTAGEFEVTATYTPAGGGQPVTRRVVIFISPLELNVRGATRVSGNNDTFVTFRHTSESATVIATLSPGPFCVPSSLVSWSGGTAAPDPLRRHLSRTITRQSTVSASIAGVTRSVNIVVLDVTIAPIDSIGINQNHDIRITLDPTPLPAGITISLRLRRASGTGEARFVSTDSTLMTIAQTTTVSVRGITASNVADNIQLIATITGQHEVIAQEDFTVIVETMILHPALGFSGLVEPGGEVKVLFLAKNDLWSQREADGRSMLQLGWRLAPWSDPQQSQTVEVLSGPNKIETARMRRSNEGWVLIDHNVQLNSHLMTLYGQSGFGRIMVATIKAPPTQGMYRLVNRFTERSVLHEAIRRIHTLSAFADDMPLIPDLGTTSVTTREGRNSNTPVEYHHPIYVTEKPSLDIAHVTDTHVALRWELYERRARASDRFNNYNRRFEAILSHSYGHADMVLLTGDIVDYNRGHFHPWEDVNDLDDDYQFNRNWLLAYELLLNSYGQNSAKPIFTMTGNHDWNLNAYAPIPHFLGFELYKSSHDFNLVERDIERIDPGDVFESDVAGKDKFSKTTPAAILWYSLVINPFLDYAFAYKDMAFLCLDWGNGAGLFPPFEEAAFTVDMGILPYPTQSLSDNQWSLVREWHRTNQNKKTKILSLHATVYQPYPEIGFQDLSQGRIHAQLIIDDPPPEYHPTRLFYTRYTHGELIWGTIINAHHRRDLINFCRENLINLVLYGHCHRNTIFQIREQNLQSRVFMYRPNEMAVLDPDRTLFVSTTSAGPLGFRNDSGVAEHLDGLKKRTKILPGYRLIRFSSTGAVASLNTYSADGPSGIRQEVQSEFRDG